MPTAARIELVPVDPHDLGVLLDPRTVMVRYVDELLQHYVTTQAWRWDGGDAIVVMVGSHTEVVIRVGDTVRTLRAGGVKRAIELMGLDPRDYEVRPQAARCSASAS